MKEDTVSIRRGSSRQRDPEEAVDELYEAIKQDDDKLNVVFVSPSYDRKKVENRLRERFGQSLLIGCTTAGEFGPDGYLDGSLSGFSLAGDDFDVEVQGLTGLRQFDFPQAQELVLGMLSRLRERGADCTEETCFGYLLVDGLSIREENIVSSLYSVMNGIPLFGGSSGDELEFKQTWVLFDGEFKTDAAVFAVIHTRRAFEVFKTQHFVSSETKFVVTEADPARRVVMEMNGDPAAVAYAEALGVAVEDLSPELFAANPLVLRLGDTNYVRSIQKMNDDQSLSFYCAIDEGIVLTLAQGHDLMDNLKNALERVQSKTGDIDLVIGCDCVLRNLEVTQTKIKSDVGRLFNEYNVVGFSTYGEQFNAMHVNQTFTGVALGKKVRSRGT